jgi:hypothetical protein
VHAEAGAQHALRDHRAAQRPRPASTAASLSSTSIAYSADSQFIDLTITVDDAVAPVDEVAVFLYNSAGQGGEVSFGGVTTSLSGP